MPDIMPSLHTDGLLSAQAILDTIAREAMQLHPDDDTARNAAMVRAISEHPTLLRLLCDPHLAPEAARLIGRNPDVSAVDEAAE